MDAELRPGTRLDQLERGSWRPGRWPKSSQIRWRRSSFLKASSLGQANSQVEVKFLVAEAEKQKKKLELSEQKLQEYKEDNDAMSLDERRTRSSAS